MKLRKPKQGFKYSLDIKDGGAYPEFEFYSKSMALTDLLLFREILGRQVEITQANINAYLGEGKKEMTLTNVTTETKPDRIDYAG